MVVGRQAAGSAVSSGKAGVVCVNQVWVCVCVECVRRNVCCVRVQRVVCVCVAAVCGQVCMQVCVCVGCVFVCEPGKEGHGRYSVLLCVCVCVCCVLWCVLNL